MGLLGATPKPACARWRAGCPLAIAFVIVGCMLLAAAPAHGEGGKKRAFKPVHRTDRVLVFRPKRVSAHAVRKAALRFRVRRRDRVARRSRRVATARVRRAVRGGKRLKLRRPRGATSGQLLVRSRSSRGSTAPAPSRSCAFGSFSSTNQPGACWRPYGDASPFNVGIPAAPRVVSNSNAIVARTIAFGPAQGIEAGLADTPDDWSHPIYFSGPSDPLYTVHCTEAWGACEIEGMQVRIPAAARPAGGGDAHMAVIDQAGGWEYDLWQVRDKPPAGGTITISWGGRTAIGTPDADGLGTNATAAHFGLAAGTIRAAELEAGRIDHALFMGVKCTNGTYVWPAEGPGSGRPCSEIGLPNENAPALGQHFYLAMSDAEIEALDLPSWKRTIMRAMAEYGMFVGDTGGTSFGFMTESGSSQTSFGFEDPWTRLARASGVASWHSSSTGSQKWLFDLEGIDWSRLRVAEPCVAQLTC